MQSAPDHTATAGYRTDIDGLRAVAVLLVLFDHLGVPFLQGGYVGVDVFFVISGYLISRLLVKELDAGQFSIGRFYLRRFRRIAPALLAMLAVTTVLAYLYLFPPELQNFAQTEAGALLSFSNVVLLHQTSYFDAMRALSPLLHTWSLGVEEQFYIVFPLALFALCRWGRRQLKPILWLLTVLGFLLCCYGTHVDQTAAFYLAPFRAWELLLGTLLAVRALPPLATQGGRNIAAAAGLVLVLVAGVRYTERTPFPGWYALAPCVGAVLILAAGEAGSSVVGRMLSSKPMRAIGLISYSLYLWHWPIQVFQSTNNLLVRDRYPQWVAECVVAVVSVAVAGLSWRFIERPFRNGRRLSARLPLFAIQGALSIVIAGFAAQLIHGEGWLPRGMPSSAAARDFDRVSPPAKATRWGTCYVYRAEFPAKFDPSVCLADVPGRPHSLLLGDSHAAALYWGLKVAFPMVNLSQLNVTGCAPLLHADPRYGCQGVDDLIFNDLARRHFDTILLAGRWHEEDFDRLGETLDWIQQHGMRAVVFGPSIEYDRSLPRLIEVADRDHDAGMFLRHRDRAPEQLDARMAVLARDRWHVSYVSIYQTLCKPAAGPPSPDECPVRLDGGMPLLWDTDHLSAAGSVFFAQAIRGRGLEP